MYNPKVSVIIPVYNVEKYLRECLDSVINQTLKDIEIIVIDDGSGDNCPEIIDEYAAKDFRVKAIHKTNSGYGHSCNIGLQNASGQYIAILEPDDFIEFNMYEVLFDIAVKNNSDIVKSGFYHNLDINGDNKIYQEKWDDTKIPADPFTIKEFPQFLYYHPSIWSSIYKREFILKNNIKFVEAPGAGWTDNPFQVQVLCLAERINYTPDAFYYWRQVNTNAADDLKDYSIPFKRMEEIITWLDLNKVDDKNILEAVYKKGFIYTRIVLNMSNISDVEDCLRRLVNLFRSMDSRLILNSNFFSFKDKIKYLLTKNFPRIIYLKSRFKQIMKKISARFCFGNRS